MDLTAFNARVMHARAIVVEARRQLRRGSWIPADFERHVAYLLCNGSYPMVNLEPYPLPSSIWDRAHRVSAWSSRLRLSILAGGWTEPDLDTDAVIPAQMRLADILTAMWQIGVLVEPWAEELRCHYPRFDGAAEFIDAHPDVYAAIETAEEVFDEPAHLRDLLDEIWTGRVRSEFPSW
ncbi:hypothetical protein ACFVVM_14725 [Nocardia sp. NPDC058176]|uniref:hypothetical protein n=1 Tax=Nocardia sp. NPDC058176 TaxID=3346368 RepID=UPI0036D9D169